MTKKKTRNLSWDDSKFTIEVGRNVKKGMKEAMIFVEGIAKKKVSRANKDGLSPSLEGEPPKVVTGTLRSNIDTEVAESKKAVHGFLGVRKGPASKYGRRLELGFVGTDSLGRNVNQGPRPFLRPSVSENSKAIARLILKS